MPVTKPTILPRWATGIAAISEPSASDKDTGFVPGTPASAAHTNWLLNRLYLWMQYLDDPATFTAQSIVAGGLTINGGALSTPSVQTGTLASSGNVTVGGTLGVTGALTAGAGLTIPAGQIATMQGNATVGGALGVTGAATVGGTLGVTGVATVGGLTAVANQHVTVSGTGDYKHGDKTLQLPASAGTPVNVSDGMSGHPATGATGWKYSRSIGGAAQFWYGPVANQEVVFPITLKVGDRIKSVAARIQDTTGAGNTISMHLHKSAATSSFLTGSAQVGATQTSAANATLQTLTLSGLNAIINSFEMYNLSLRANGTAFTNHRILGVQVTYDRP